MEEAPVLVVLQLVALQVVQLVALQLHLVIQQMEEQEALGPEVLLMLEEPEVLAVDVVFVKLVLLLINMLEVAVLMVALDMLVVLL